MGVEAQDQLEAAATLGSRGAETPSLLSTGHCSQALNPGLNSSLACPSGASTVGVVTPRALMERSAVPRQGPLPTFLWEPSELWVQRPAVPFKRRSVPVLSLAGLGVLGQGLPRRAGRPEHCALVGVWRGFHQQKWCLRH